MIMSTTSALQAQTSTCPTWCTDTDGVYGLHFGEVHEVGPLALCLTQAPGEAPMIGLNDDTDQEFSISLYEAEQLGQRLVQIAREGRQAAVWAV
jgi:hypothetical protein